ncbi:MAG: hypothetical protein DRQ56_07030 [Gammaproteobacteria bacterium]|nr:MAG: hypothetical protein DRQ56_07030 [Gammaproteobacteria bacterium]
MKPKVIGSAMYFWILLLASVFPLTVAGDEGRIEISSVAATVGGITSGDAPGYPVQLTAAGSYVLTSNLLVPADTTGILITADDVSLDLNGFGIIGPVICTGVLPAITCPAGAGQGISSGNTGVVVSAGIVSGFADGGIVLGDSASVHDILTRRNSRVGIQVSERGHVQRVRAIENDGDGIVAGHDSVVTANNITGNSGVGTVLGAGAGSSRNVINQNGSISTGGLLLSDNVCNRGLSCTSQCTDTDADNFFSDCTPLDCDDNEVNNFPGNTEVCDSIDNNCDGNVDEGDVCAVVTVCGDGLVEGTEACDDFNASSCGTCNATCTGPGTGMTCTSGEGCGSDGDCLSGSCSSNFCD